MDSVRFCNVIVGSKMFGRKILNVFLSIDLNMRFGCSKEPSQ